MSKSISRPNPFQPWIIWGLGALFFFSNYIVRVAPNVLMTELMHDFQRTATTISLFGTFFLLPYVAIQIPLGMLTDSFGAKKILFFAISLFAIFTLVFAASHIPATAILARACLGVTSAAAFLGAIKLATAWFPPERLALVVGLTQALGLLGGAFGIWPFGDLYDAFGWRFIMVCLFGFYCLLAISIGLFVKNHPKEKKTTANTAELKQNTHERPTKQDCLKVLTSPQTWINGCYAGLVFTTMTVLGEIFGVSFLTQVHHLPESGAKIATFLMFIGWVVGGPIAGIIADKIGRKKVMLYSSLIGIILVPIIVYVPLNAFLVFILMFLFGITNTGLVASYTAAGEMHDKQSAGLSVSIANMLSVLIGASIIPLVGKLLDLQHPAIVDGKPVYTALIYQKALFLLPISMVLAFICALLVKETLALKVSHPHLPKE